jgi:agmatine deiminase
MKSNKSKFLPPEWYPQSGVMVTWPHEKSDWIDLLDEVINCFVLISNEILKEEKLLVICSDPDLVTQKLDKSLLKNLILVQLESNDTWARDHGPITRFVDGKPELLDFQFNGWGLKFPACLDNQLTRQLFEKKNFSEDVCYRNCLDFVFEGGSFETDGLGTLLTTESCLLSINRNQKMSKKEIETYLIHVFNLQRVIWLKSGYLAGDDTDSHVDTWLVFAMRSVSLM